MLRMTPIESPTAPGRPSLLIDLEARQEDVLRQLDELNRRIDVAVAEARAHRAPSERE
jgi:hypothetical protein